MEAMDDADAKGMIPPVLRANAKVVRLFEFTSEHVDLLHHFSHEQFLQLRKLSDQQLKEVLGTSAGQVHDIVLRLLGEEPPTQG